MWWIIRELISCYREGLYSRKGKVQVIEGQQRAFEEAKRVLNQGAYLIFAMRKRGLWLLLSAVFFQRLTLGIMVTTVFLMTLSIVEPFSALLWGSIITICSAIIGYGSIVSYRVLLEQLKRAKKIWKIRLKSYESEYPDITNEL